MKSVSKKPRVRGERELIGLSLPFSTRTRRRFTVICPKLPPVVTYGEL
jgi:hypothetical protein